jgi:hypothetical protein
VLISDLGYQRGYIMVTGSLYAVPYDITFEGFDNLYSVNLHDDIGELNKCSNVYGASFLGENRS